jgi:hypothetical protein
MTISLIYLVLNLVIEKISISKDRFKLIFVALTTLFFLLLHSIGMKEYGLYGLLLSMIAIHLSSETLLRLQKITVISFVYIYILAVSENMLLNTFILVSINLYVQKSLFRKGINGIDIILNFSFIASVAYTDYIEMNTFWLKAYSANMVYLSLLPILNQLSGKLKNKKDIEYGYFFNIWFFTAWSVLMIKLGYMVQGETLLLINTIQYSIIGLIILRILQSRKLTSILIAYAQTQIIYQVIWVLNNGSTMSGIVLLFIGITYILYLTSIFKQKPRFSIMIWPVSLIYNITYMVLLNKFRGVDNISSIMMLFTNMIIVYKIFVYNESKKTDQTLQIGNQ